MSVEKLLGKSKEEIKALSTDQALSLFKEQITTRNSIEEAHTKYNVVPALVFGCLVGAIVSQLVLTKKT